MFGRDIGGSVYSAAMGHQVGTIDLLAVNTVCSQHVVQSELYTLWTQDGTQHNQEDSRMERFLSHRGIRRSQQQRWGKLTTTLVLVTLSYFLLVSSLYASLLLCS